MMPKISTPTFPQFLHFHEALEPSSSRRTAKRSLQLWVWRWALSLLLSTALDLQKICWKGSWWLPAAGEVLMLCFVRSWGWASLSAAQLLPSSISKRWLLSPGQLCSGEDDQPEVLSLFFRASQPLEMCLFTPSHPQDRWKWESKRHGSHGALSQAATTHCWVCDLLCLGVGRRSNRLCCEPTPSWAPGGRARKKAKNKFLLFKLSIISQRVTVITQRLLLYQCRSHSVLLRAGSLTCGVSSVYLLCGILLPSPHPLSATGSSQAKAGTSNFCTVQRHRSWGQMLLWKGFFNKKSESLGMEFQGKCSTNPLLSNWRKLRRKLDDKKYKCKI